MKPGVYEGLPAAEYHAIEAVSNSRLSRLAVTPAHLRAYIEEPQKSTPAMIEGSAIHTLTLEPHLWHEEYLTAGTCAATKKGDGQRCTNAGSLYLDGEWFCRTKGHAPDGAGDPDRIVLTEDVAARCYRVAQSVRAHPKIGRLLAREGRAELTVVWEDAETGLLCKGRVDWLTETRAGWTALDLKTTTDASPRAFERTIADRGYHRQLPFYEEGLRANGIDLRHLVFAAAEKEPPYAVAAYRLTEGAADEGRIEYRAMLRQYAELIETPRETWPAYGDDIIDLALPAWAYGRVREDMAA